MQRFWSAVTTVSTSRIFNYYCFLITKLTGIGVTENNKVSAHINFFFPIHTYTPHVRSFSVQPTHKTHTTAFPVPPRSRTPANSDRSLFCWSNWFCVSSPRGFCRFLYEYLPESYCSRVCNFGKEPACAFLEWNFEVRDGDWIWCGWYFTTAEITGVVVWKDCMYGVNAVPFTSVFCAFCKVTSRSRECRGCGINTS